jgi:hypothetical protein
MIGRIVAVADKHLDIPSNYCLTGVKTSTKNRWDIKLEKCITTDKPPKSQQWDVEDNDFGHVITFVRISPVAELIETEIGLCAGWPVCRRFWISFQQCRKPYYWEGALATGWMHRCHWRGFWYLHFIWVQGLEQYSRSAGLMLICFTLKHILRTMDSSSWTVLLVFS